MGNAVRDEIVIPLNYPQRGDGGGEDLRALGTWL